MWRVGFGLEKLGLLAQRRPVLFSLLVLVLIAVAGVNFRNVAFTGSVLAVLPDSSRAFRDYEEIKDDYRNFSRDVTVLVESDRLLTSEGMEALRNLQLDISLSDGVTNASSIFSVPDFDVDSGEVVEWFPEELGSDGETADLVDRLIAKYPPAASLLDRQRKVAVIIATLTAGVQEDDGVSFEAFRRLREDALAAAPEDFKLSFTGLTPIGAAILETLIDDQVKLTGLGLLLGTLIAYLIFRNFLAALLCAIPPVLTALWAFGLFAFFGIRINYLTTVLPSLALILAFADGIFLYFRWQTLNSHHHDAEENLTEAITRVGPASSLTSITTALAFLSFAYADSEALKEFAYLGAGAVSLAFIAVIVGLPVSIHWAIRLGLARTGIHKEPAFQRVGKQVRPAIIGHPWILALAGVVLVGVLCYTQKDITAEYRLVEYLPSDSNVRYGELLADEVTGGRALMLISVPFAESGGLENPANRARLEAVDAVAAEQFGADKVFSARQLFATASSETAKAKIAGLLGEAAEREGTSLESKRGDASLVTVRLSSQMPVAQVEAETRALRKRLSALSYGADVRVTGFPVLMSIEFTHLIEQLRISLILAISFGVVILGIATRSPLMFLAATTPNLLPIFFILSLLYLKGGTVNMSEVVALTLAFGIAIDNAVHLINVFDSQRKEGKETRHALASALEEAGPALTAGTVIICVSFVVTQFSAMPLVPALGELIIATLVVALLSNLLILPANILTLEGLKQRFFPSEPQAGSDAAETQAGKAQP